MATQSNDDPGKKKANDTNEASEKVGKERTGLPQLAAHPHITNAFTLASHEPIFKRAASAFCSDGWQFSWQHLNSPLPPDLSSPSRSLAQ